MEQSLCPSIRPQISHQFTCSLIQLDLFQSFTVWNEPIYLPCLMLHHHEIILPLLPCFVNRTSSYQFIDSDCLTRTTMHIVISNGSPKLHCICIRIHKIGLTIETSQIDHETKGNNEVRKFNGGFEWYVKQMGVVVDLTCPVPSHTMILKLIGGRSTCWNDGSYGVDVLAWQSRIDLSGRHRSRSTLVGPQCH